MMRSTHGAVRAGDAGHDLRRSKDRPKAHCSEDRGVLGARPLPRPSCSRRAFVAHICLAPLALPAAAAAAKRPYRVGLLEAIPAEENKANLEAFRRGLRERGLVEGRNLVIVYRSADGRAERFPDLAADLVRNHVDLIVARGTPATRATLAATGSIPVVMATMGDPRPMVTSFARPGGNVTGLTTYSTELSGKRVELLKEFVPSLAHVTLLHDMANPAAHPEWDETRKAAASLGLVATLVDVRSAEAIERAFEKLRPHEGLVVGADGLIQMHRKPIVDLAARARVPAVYPGRDFVEAGGLMAYALDYANLYFRLASYVDRIAHGASPGELPIEQPTRFELVINAATAARLDLPIPTDLRLRADALIE